MSLFISSLNSGSNGNCYYIGNSNEAVLVDVGISCREVEKRMLRSELSIRKVKAIFISHEHTDHIKGVEVLSKKYQIPVYITEPTLTNGRLKIESSLINTFKAYEQNLIGELSIVAFPKLHDAVDPYSFTIEQNGIKIGVFTDIGDVCAHVIENFKQCHAIFLEANYDETMLEQGRYPYHLKRRIRGGKGHLSNAQALGLVKNHKPTFMSHLFLSHLSKENNCPIMVNDLFKSNFPNTNIIVASRYYETEVYNISKILSERVKESTKKQVETMQMSLF